MLDCKSSQDGFSLCLLMNFYCYMDKVQLLSAEFPLKVEVDFFKVILKTQKVDLYTGKYSTFFDFAP